MALQRGVCRSILLHLIEDTPTNAVLIVSSSYPVIRVMADCRFIDLWGADGCARGCEAHRIVDDAVRACEVVKGMF
jgi:hypothetical protein